MLHAYVYYTFSTYQIVVSNDATLGITVDAATTLIEEVKKTQQGKITSKADAMLRKSPSC